MRLPGFERFYAPRARVEVRGETQSIDHPAGKLLSLELVIDGQPTTVYLNAATGLPVGSGRLHPEAPYFEFGYRRVSLDAPVSDLRVPPLPTAAQVFNWMTEAVGALRRFELMMSHRPHQPFRRFRAAYPLNGMGKGIVTLDGTYSRAGHLLPPKGTYLPKPPGFEAFFRAKPLGTAEGETQVAKGTSCYTIGVRDARVKNRRWTLYVDNGDYLPRGYDLNEGGMRKQSVRYDLMGVTSVKELGSDRVSWEPPAR